MKVHRVHTTLHLTTLPLLESTAINNTEQRFHLCQVLLSLDTLLVHEGVQKGILGMT